ncbi:MAG: TolC family protein [Muribaculaceae bacterium]|nr:TolC family protein [Muribaculaceae bacterium]
MKTLYTIALLMLAGMASAQDMQGILLNIERNNTTLSTLRSDNVAAAAQMNSETSIIGPTTVEYSPFFGGGADGLASSELIVSQEFEFPILGTMRKESNAAQQQVLDLQYQQARRDVLLEAKNLCYDLSGAVKMRNLLQEREHTADSLLAAYETSMKHGKATIIDVNRIKMDRMTVHTQLVQAQGNITTIIAQLQSLNGGHPVEGADNLILPNEPLGDINAISLEENIAQAAYNATTHEVRLASSGWLPSFTVGYRRNTDAHQASNGFVVGVSMPLFSNTNKVKAARARQQAAHTQVDNAHTEALNRQHALLVEAQQLRATIDSYDLPLMQQTLALINKAIGAGVLTVPEYYNQADRIHATMQELINLETRYNKLMVELNRNSM